MENPFAPILEALECLKEDPMIIKRVKEKVQEIIVLLQQNSNLGTDKALRELEEISASEIPSYDRAQLWDIISQLESITSLTLP